MKQKLLLLGFVILFPKLIIFFILIRLTFAVKAIKYGLLFIVLLCILLVISTCVAVAAIMECCSNRFREARLIIKMIVWSLVFFAVLWAVNYSIRCFRKKLGQMLTNWTISPWMTGRALYEHIA